MTVQAVTFKCTGTAHYWLNPVAIEDTSGAGVEIGHHIEGWIAPWMDVPDHTMTFELDDTYEWDIAIRFKNAAPVLFSGFKPAAGDLLELLGTQGWVPL